MTNKMCMEVYKNYDYNIQDGNDSDDSDSDIEYEEFYRTNTRMVLILDASLKIELEPSNKILNVNVKLRDLTAYTLWTTQYSPKWSSELLLDTDQSITLALNGLLSKMGFVNVLNVSNFDVNLSSLPVDLEKSKNLILKAQIASLDEILENDEYELQVMTLKFPIKDSSNTLIKQDVAAKQDPSDKLTISINLSSVIIY